MADHTTGLIYLTEYDRGYHDGIIVGQKEAVKKCIEWFFSNTVFTQQKVKEFAEQFGVNVITEDENET